MSVQTPANIFFLNLHEMVVTLLFVVSWVFWILAIIAGCFALGASAKALRSQAQA